MALTVGLLASSSASAWVNGGCRWYPAHWQNGQWVPAHKVCFDRGYRQTRNNGYWRNGYWHRGQHNVWRR
jgi:hypothetical protein